MSFLSAGVFSSSRLLSTDGTSSEGASSGGTGNKSNHKDLFSRALSAVGPDDDYWDSNPSLDMLVFNKGQEVHTEINHNLPIRTGISYRPAFFLHRVYCQPTAPHQKEPRNMMPMSFYMLRFFSV